MIAIEIKNRIIHIPSSFDELENEQYFRWCELMHAGLKQSNFNVLMLINLLKWNSHIFLKAVIWREKLYKFLDKITFGVFVFTIQDFDIEEVAELSEIFSEKIELPIKNYLPKILLNGISYIGPETYFANITFRQFRKAEENFAIYQRTKNIENLNLLIAWLYVPNVFYKEYLFQKKYLAFGSTQARAKALSKIKESHKIAILYFYAANRSKLCTIYKDLYDTEDDDTTQQKKVTVKSIRMGFEKSLRALSGNVNNDEKTDFQPALDVLAHLNDKAEQAKILRKLYKQ